MSLLRGSPLRLLSPVRPVQLDFVRHSKISKRRKDEQIKHAPHLVFKAPERTPTYRAISYFDDHYAKVFGRRWPSIRLALLSQPKHCALVNNFAPVEETRATLREIGCLSLKELVGTQMDGIYRVPEPPKLQPRREKKKNYADKADVLEPVKAEEVSMPLEEEVVRGRLILPSEQILRGQNQAAALHDFIATKEIKGMEDFVEEEEYYESYQKLSGGVTISVVEDRSIIYPTQLDAYVFPSSNLSRFPQPKKTVLSTFDYYCMDLASLLPVIALGVRPQDQVLDMCSGPGGKSLAVLQTLLPASLVCNDKSSTRLKRVMDVMDMYLKDVGSVQKDTASFIRWDGLELPAMHSGKYDKILCDVPCFTDRHVVREDENNIFAVQKKKERILMPKLQTDLLVSAIRCVKPGGSVVYSTCSLSPMQNDGVVHAALRRIWEDTDIDVVVNNLSAAFAPFKSLMNLVNEECSLKYGQLVLPHLANNFGPMYFAKITRTQ